MPRSILSVVLALALLVGFTTLAKADVQGSFDIHIALEPEGTQTEAVKFFIDLQSELDIVITLSGLSIGFDIGFGTTGIEFAILTLDTNLGALAIHDDFVFAPPFGCTDFAVGASWPAVQAGSGQCAGKNVMPVGDNDNDGFPDNDAVGFVKKRVEMTLNIAGITLENTALFEDVDFPDIHKTEDHTHDHYNHNGVESVGTYNVGDVDSDVDNQTPTYGFGDVISLSGQTVSGISVTGTTGFCASGTNRIKKKNFTYEVNKSCTASVGDLTDPIEPDEEGVGQKTPLLFEFETLSIDGIEIGGVVLDFSTTWEPNKKNGLSTSITATFSVLDLAEVEVLMSSNNITALTLSSITIFVSTGNLSLVLSDDDGDLDIDSTNAVLSVVLNPNQNPASLTIDMTVANPGGLTDLTITLGISKGALFLDTVTTFSGGPGTLAWGSTKFSLGVDMGNGFSFSGSFSYGTSGMGPTSLTLGIEF